MKVLIYRFPVGVCMCTWTFASSYQGDRPMNREQHLTKREETHDQKDYGREVDHVVQAEQLL